MDWLAFWLPLISALVVILAIASLIILVADDHSEGRRR